MVVNNLRVIFLSGLARENERKLEKLSLRKQLKLKCQEQNLNAIHGRAMVQIGVSADVYQPITVQGYEIPCKDVPLVVFHVRVLC